MANFLKVERYLNHPETSESSPYHELAVLIGRYRAVQAVFSSFSHVFPMILSIAMDFVCSVSKDFSNDNDNPHALTSTEYHRTAEYNKYTTDLGLSCNEPSDIVKAFDTLAFMGITLHIGFKLRSAHDLNPSDSCVSTARYCSILITICNFSKILDDVTVPVTPVPQKIATPVVGRLLWATFITFVCANAHPFLFNPTFRQYGDEEPPPRPKPIPYPTTPSQ